MWLPNGRLFSASLYGSITEWDILACGPKVNLLILLEIWIDLNFGKKSYDSFGGPVWSMAGSASNLLAAGCEDGSIRLFDASEEDTLTWKKTFLKQEGRILSCCFHPTTEEIFTGASDGTIRQFDIKTGKTLQLIKVENRGNPEATLIWALVVLKFVQKSHGRLILMSFFQNK